MRLATKASPLSRTNSGSLAAIGHHRTGRWRQIVPGRSWRRWNPRRELNRSIPDAATAEVYGQISARLSRFGVPIPQNDIWIAAIAKQAGLPLATGDKHFSEVDGLPVLLW
jgi:predicted nucleic acid-binding protein